MTTFLREDIINKLKDNVCEVVFTKKDGTERVMKATLKEDVVEPLSEGFTTRVVKKYDENQIRCVDTEKNAWRSFKLDTVISFKVEGE